MWEVVVAIVIVGVALYFSARSLLRSLRGGDEAGHCAGCAGCSLASSCKPDEREERTGNPCSGER